MGLIPQRTAIGLDQSQNSIYLARELLSRSRNQSLNKERFQKKVWKFPYFPKPTHPTRLVWKQDQKSFRCNDKTLMFLNVLEWSKMY